jgi:hypothetical protein
MNAKLRIPMTYEAGEEMAINVKLDHYNEKRAIRLAEAKAYADLGVQVAKVKTGAYAKIGAYAMQLGIRKVGHGQIIAVSGTAEDAVDKIDALIEQLMTAEKPADPAVIAALMQTKLGFTRLALDSGEMHLKADRAVNEDKKGPNLSMPFPAGSSVVISSSKPLDTTTSDVIEQGGAAG